MAQDPNKLKAQQIKPGMEAMRVSVGDPGKENIKTTGIVQRGAGAATKGKTARGPMA
jgi:hypothetical protein